MSKESTPHVVTISAEVWRELLRLGLTHEEAIQRGLHDRRRQLGRRKLKKPTDPMTFFEQFEHEVE